MEQQHEKNDVESEVKNSINKKKKRKGGRPRLTSDEKRSFQIKVGFTPSQYQKLAERAETANLNQPEFIRRICINQPIYTIPKVNSAALIELNKVGVNINQLTKISHTSANFNALAELQKITIELQKIGKQIAWLL